MKFTLLSILMAVSTVSAAAIPHYNNYNQVRSASYHVRSASFKHYYPRQSDSINATIAGINSNTQELAQAVTDYKGGLLAAGSLASKESALSTSLQSATTSVESLPQLNSAQSQAALSSVNTLMPNIKAALDALMSRQGEIQSAGLNGIVGGDIGQLKTQTDALGNALLSKASPDVKPAATEKLQSIDAMFQPALAAFGASG